MAAGRGMKIGLAAAALGLVAAVGLARLGGGSKLAPDFTATDLKGQRVRLSAYRGKVVLVNLWATWCPPCREEMPSMERLYGRLHGRDFVERVIGPRQWDAPAQVSALEALLAGPGGPAEEARRGPS